MAAERHVIRLREPWSSTGLGGGAWRYSRRFGRPTGLCESDRVFLVVLPVEDVAAPPHVTLNGQSLDWTLREGTGESQWDITGLLAPRNELGIELVASSLADSLPPQLGLTRIEIVSG